MEVRTIVALGAAVTAATTVAGMVISMISVWAPNRVSVDEGDPSDITEGRRELNMVFLFVFLRCCLAFFAVLLIGKSLVEGLGVGMGIGILLFAGLYAGYIGALLLARIVRECSTQSSRGRQATEMDGVEAEGQLGLRSDGEEMVVEDPSLKDTSEVLDLARL